MPVGILRLAMLTIRQFALRATGTAAWRSVLAGLLITLTAFAPVARAMCDIKPADTAGAAGSTAARVSVYSVLNPNAVDYRLCRADRCNVIAERVQPTAADTGVTPSTPVLHVIAPAFGYLSVPTIGTEIVSRRLSLPPSEPAFRRVPKLLL